MTQQQIFDVVTDYFGEERVECCAENNRVTIHFPIVTISNEHDDKHIIKDLWIRFTVTEAGQLYNRFVVSRTTYTYAEWVSDYAHSHIPGKCTPDRWLAPCTGEGPINNIIAILSCGGDETDWMIFCRELEQWTQVESEIGIPYRHMKDISNVARRNNIITNPLEYKLYADNYDVNDSIVREIAKTCISRGLGAVVIQGGKVRYKLDDTYLALAISKVAREILPPTKFVSAYINNRLLYRNNEDHQSNIPSEYYDGVYAFDFKGRPIKTVVSRHVASTSDNCEVKLVGCLRDIYNIMNRIVATKLAKYHIEYGTV